jgi:hypothetical protein
MWPCSPPRCFSVHTTNTETLNTISARSELLSAIGLVGSFLMYFYLPSSRRLRLYLLPMMAGTLAKTPAIVFAPMLLAYMLLFEKRLSIADVFSRRSWRAVRDAVLASAPAFVIGVVTYLAGRVDERADAEPRRRKPVRLLFDPAVRMAALRTDVRLSHRFDC